MDNLNNSKFYFLLSILFFVLLLSIFYFLDFGSDKNQASVSDTSVLGKGFLKYIHPEIGFSLEYPENLEVKSFEEKDNGETIIFQKKGDKQEWSAQEKTGFQIFVLPFEGDGKELTKEKILKDLPGIVIENPLEVVIGENTGRSIHAFVFWSNSDKIGKTREVWFTDRGYLFEITTYEHLDGWLAQIMSTWGFE